MVDLEENKSYRKYSLIEEDTLFKGHIDDFSVDLSMIRKLSKDLGFSFNLYETLLSIDVEAALTMVKSMSSQSKHNEILLLLDEENKVVLDYSLETDRLPLLNNEFIHRVCSLVDAYEDVKYSEVYYNKENTISSILISRVPPVRIEEKSLYSDEIIHDYIVGVLLINDEVGTTSCRLAVVIDGQPLYLPASYYSSSISRYKRSTSSSYEALEVLVLKIIDDLRGDNLQSKLQDLHYRRRSNNNILASYEEYNTLLRTMRKIPTIIEDPTFLEPLVEDYENFEKKYSDVEDQKSSYIWRCTAMSEKTLGSLISKAISILNDLYAEPIEYFNTRELLGSYISTNRIADEVAKEIIR